MYTRRAIFEAIEHESYFLWGPRQSGKSTLLKKIFPNSIYIDLLLSTEYRKLIHHPQILREQYLALGPSEQQESQPIIIDEVQKIPDLLDEVQWLIVNHNVRFILCGSSARKLKRGHGNLLGGRALRMQLHPLIYLEIPDFDLSRALNHGLLPKIYQNERYNQLLKSYISDYLKEEILAESLIRNISAFSNFLDAMALSNGEIINYVNIARDCAISAPTVKEYFQILIDTLLGYYIPAYTKTIKRRAIHSPKFYMFDVGVINSLAKRGNLEQGSELFGKAFEHFILMELKAYSDYSEKNFTINYWRSASGVEVDFIIGDSVAIEVKSSILINLQHTKNIRMLKEENLLKTYLVVSLDENKRITDEGITIIPWRDFLLRLWQGEYI
ncbi:MAG: AAA family ATPase [Candidatus Margulisbacteria bacterium GWF2_35_9]|nr:MAG: AAA family ATPase [Candidatus Margulisbacteria bacterium GWF2_35_9]